MGISDLFAGEIATELLKLLINISRKSCYCKSSAEQLIIYLNELLPTIQEIKYSGVELPAIRQSRLDRFSETLQKGKELAEKVLSSNRWNVYRNLQLARKMEKLEKDVTRFLEGPFQAFILADVHHLRAEYSERWDRLEGSTRRLEQRLGSMNIGVGGGIVGGVWLEEAVKRAEEEDMWGSSLLNLGVTVEVGKVKVKEMVIGREDLPVVGISGIGGSGKTTLAREFCRDPEVRSYFKEKILFLTVSQSPNIEQLKARIWGHIMGNPGYNSCDVVPKWNLQYEWGTPAAVKTLVVLDDVWSGSVLDQLITKIPGCKFLVVSRNKYSQVCSAAYEVELLREDEAISLFCHFAFGQDSIPSSANANLVKQIVSECKGLPLALKVIGASLRDQMELFWQSAKNKLSRGESIGESHETKLLQRMSISIDVLPPKVRDCFLDLGAFPEDKKIPLDILINIWVEAHDLNEDDAIAIVVELSNKNLLTLVKDAQAGDIFSSYYEIFVTQHDVLRDLAIHFSGQSKINDRERLLMARRETELPREWSRHSDKPFKAKVVSVHTGEMKEMDWTHMEFPFAEVLVLNFSSSEYFLPPFICNMPKLKAIILINYGTSSTTLQNFSVFADLNNLRSLWLEKVSVPQLSFETVPLRDLHKISLVLCNVNNSLDESVELSQIFPNLLELTIDHCDDLIKLPSSICNIPSLRRLSVTNCHYLCLLPSNFGKLTSLEILRLYACPMLKNLPLGLCELVVLKYIDISQCVNLTGLPQEIGKLVSLEKIDMRECCKIRSIPKSVGMLQSLRSVICEEDVSDVWKTVAGGSAPQLYVQVAQRCFDLDWLDD